MHRRRAEPVLSNLIAHDTAVGAAAFWSTAPAARTQRGSNLPRSLARLTNNMVPAITQRDASVFDHDGVVSPGVQVCATVRMRQLPVQLNANPVPLEYSVRAYPPSIDPLGFLFPRLRQTVCALEIVIEMFKRRFDSCLDFAENIGN